MNSRFTVNAGWLFVAQIFNYLAPLLVLPYLTRTLPQAEFGAVMVAFSAVQLGFVITDYGFSLSATQAIAQSDRSPAAVNPLIASIFTAKILLCAIATSCLVLLSFAPAYADYQPVFLAATGTIIFQAFQPIWLFQGLERMKSYALCSALTKIGYVAFVIPLVNEAGDGWLVQIAWSIANMLGMIASLYLMRQLGYRAALSPIRNAVDQLKLSGQFFASRVAVAAYTSAGTLFVSLGGMQQAALYATADQLYKAAQNLTNPINQVMYPLMSRDRDWKLFFSVFSVVATVLLIGCLIVWHFIEPLISLLFGLGYTSDLGVYGIFIVTVLVNYTGVTFGYSACSALGIIRVANTSVIFGSIVFLLAGFYLIYYDLLEAQAVASLVLLTEALVMGARVGFVSNALRRTPLPTRTTT